MIELGSEIQRTTGFGAMSEDPYWFMARCRRTKEWRRLSILPFDDRAGLHLTKVWSKKYQAVQGHYAVEEETCPSWATWKPHDWSKKQIDGRASFVAWDQDVLAGFLNVREPFASQFASNQGSLYIEHVCTSPGNCDTPIWSGRLEYVGKALLAFAVRQSVDRGFAGIVSLHSAVESVGFYDRINEEQGGDLFHGRLTNVHGFYQGSTLQPFLEMRRNQAIAFLESYKHDDI